jgi:hypothetical protein
MIELRRSRDGSRGFTLSPGPSAEYFLQMIDRRPYVLCFRATRCGSFALAALVALAFVAVAHAQTAPERRNFFGDPFFQVSHAVAQCPVPAGPFITEDERRVQAHHRAERGTTCWLAGTCDRPNDYAYDATIAEAVKAALATSPLLARTTLWVTVQGRIVFIEGCAADESVGLSLESLVRPLPDVRQAVSNVYTGAPGTKPTYKLLASP